MKSITHFMVSLFVGMLVISGCTDDVSVDARPVDRDNDGIVDSRDNCPDESGPESNQGCPEKNPDADDDGVPDQEDDCPNEIGPASNNGCPFDELSVGAITSPNDRQACVNLPIEATISETTGGSGALNYRFHLTDLTDPSNEKQQSDWAESTSFSIDSSMVTLDHVYELSVEVRDTETDQSLDYASIKFHVRGKQEGLTIPEPAAWITPVQHGGEAPTVLEWSNTSELTYDVLIDGNVVAQTIDETKYEHQLDSGTYTAKIVSIDEHGNRSETATPFEFVVP